MNIREIIVPALLLLAASLSQVAAQPAGVYLLETTHFYSDCNVNATIAISLTRFGPEVSCQPFTTSFTYRSCNTTHQLEYICEDSSCSQNCTLLSSTPLNTAIGPDFFRGGYFSCTIRSLFLQLRSIFKNPKREICHFHII